MTRLGITPTLPLIQPGIRTRASEQPAISNHQHSILSIRHILWHCAQKFIGCSERSIHRVAN